MLPANAAQSLRDFLKEESAGGVVLMIAAATALILANSPFSAVYASVLNAEVALTVSGAGIEKPALLWINDGLMAVFFAWMAVKSGFASLQEGIAWRQVYGLSLIAGIGFTMSLFIGNLAFTTPDQLAAVKLGVLSGSLISALGGILILRSTGKRHS
jgi:Na+/H+ antiporter NhaA